VGDPAAAEFSYSRALALDPKAAALWVQLGRLYSRHGSGERTITAVLWKLVLVREVDVGVGSRDTVGDAAYGTCAD
jgi:hypothetical protein